MAREQYRLGPLMLWRRPGSVSIHVGRRRVWWVRDMRRSQPLLSDRHPFNRRHVQLGPLRIRFWERSP